MKLASIPAYNEEKSIGEVVRSIPKINDRISKTEVIVVDDGTDEIKEALVNERFIYHL